MVGVVQLQRTQEYLTTLRTELHVVRNAVDDSVRSESIGRLEEKLGELSRHRRNLLQSARGIDWTDETERETYISNLESELETLDEALTALVSEGTEPDYDALEDILGELQARSNGLLEDV